MRLTDDLLASTTIWHCIATEEALAVRCDACSHVDHWTPMALQQRFAGREWLWLDALASRLRCEACGSRNGAVGPGRGRRNEAARQPSL